ncbi:MAG: transglycosylase SLT domain-containing protein [Candidatus Binatia bacterium]
MSLAIVKSLLLKTMKFLARLLAIFLIFLFVSTPGHLAGREVPRSDSPFPRFPDLEDSVEFWKLVFTQYSSSELIFFDPLDPTTIYKVLDAGSARRTRRLIRRERKKIYSERGIDKNRVRVQRGVKEQFALGLERSRSYLEQMQRIFQEEGLPIELAYLPLVESSFNTRARSHAGAVGIWQFMRSTGRRYLRINRRVDERRDPLESTRAAAWLLKENYELFGNWPLAITAYNHGRSGISRAIAKLASKDLAEIIRRYESRSFGFASKNFYAEFLAAVEVAEGAEEYFPELKYHRPFRLEEFETGEAISVATLLRGTDIPRKRFLEWNPALSPRIRIIPRGYRVKAPQEELPSLATAYREFTQTPIMRHRVTAGETLSEIARRYRTSVRKIRDLNGIRRVHLINIGQILKVPRL